LAEFALDMKVVMLGEDARGKLLAKKTARLRALLPHAFRL
jgi:hypothetical protein